MKSINVNQRVKVLFTKEARERVERDYRELARVSGEDYEAYRIYDEDGYYHTQLWLLMRDFGDMFKGCYSPISDCEIIIIEKTNITDNLEEVRTENKNEEV